MADSSNPPKQRPVWPGNKPAQRPGKGRSGKGRSNRPKGGAAGS